MKQKKGRVTGIGGIFFRSSNPEATRSWYAKHLGMEIDQWGTNFRWYENAGDQVPAHSQWSPMDEDSEHLGSSDQGYMINYRVQNIEDLVERLRDEGVEILGAIQRFAYGKFVHIRDGDGIKVELWEPVDSEYTKIVEGVTKA